VEADMPRRRVALIVGFLLLVAAILAVVWLLLNSGRAQRATAPPLPPVSSIVPTGEIVRLPGRDMAVINRGLGDGLTQGMTFEAYDKRGGLPAGNGLLPAPRGGLPAGKATLEVIRIGPGFSECRVIRTERLHVLGQGDLVVQVPDGAERLAAGRPADGGAAVDSDGVTRGASSPVSAPRR
jgi:hypothetical protein